MLSKEYGALRRQLIDPDKAMVYPSAGNPKDFQTKGLVPVNSTASQYSDEEYEDPMVGTTNFDVIDRFGNAVGVTPTHRGNFGTKVVVGNTGMLFSNGTRWGSIAPYADNVNAVQGGKMALLGNSPTVVMKDGKFFMVFGTPGGEGIGQNQFQVLLNVVDFGMDIQQAIEAPKIQISANQGLYVPGAEITVRMEKTIPEEVAKEFEAKGHKIQITESGIGGMCGIMVDPVYGTWTAGADPRRECYAVGH